MKAADNNLEFRDFIAQCFTTLNPGTTYLPNWHIDLIAYALEQAMLGNAKRLIINMPPRSLKSICVSVAWPAWLLGHNPALRIMVASYSQILSVKHSLDTRKIITSSWYKDMFPQVKLCKDQNLKSKFVTTDGGFRFATSMGGTATGEGGNFLIIDDPLSSTQAISSLLRQRAIEWFEQTFITRLDDKKKGAIVIVMQRLHSDDLAGYLIKKNSKIWKTLKLQAEVMEDHIVEFMGKKFARKKGDLLHPKREGLEEITQLKMELGEYSFSAQYQQSPIPTQGHMLKPKWLKRYSYRPENANIYHSWDSAVKTGIKHDYSVCTIWAVTDSHYYLLEVVRTKLDYPELKHLIITLAGRDKPDAILIEDKASGSSLIQDLHSENKFPVIAIQSNKDKIHRFASITPLFEAGRVLLPETSSWIAEYELELMSFPMSSHDDQVDSTSQFLNYIKRHSHRLTGVVRLV